MRIRPLENFLQITQIFLNTFTKSYPIKYKILCRQVGEGHLQEKWIRQVGQIGAKLFSKKSNSVNQGAVSLKNRWKQSQQAQAQLEKFSRWAAKEIVRCGPYDFFQIFRTKAEKIVRVLTILSFFSGPTPFREWRGSCPHLPFLATPMVLRNL